MKLTKEQEAEFSGIAKRLIRQGELFVLLEMIPNKAKIKLIDEWEEEPK